MSGVPASAEEPRLVLQREGELGRSHAHVLLEPEHETRVDAARPGGHDQALEGREAHGGVDRPPALHRGERGAGPEVAGHDPQLLERPADQLGAAPRGVRVGEPVEAVTPEPQRSRQSRGSA